MAVIAVVNKVIWRNFSTGFRIAFKLRETGRCQPDDALKITGAIGQPALSG
ncbi:MAG: hypothetical protein Q8S27_10045 [Hoeflea sp.]|nr:hypothetical protein [Hoeflea sp.]